MSGAEAGAVEAVWRIVAARLIAALSRTTGDVGLAEEFAHDALVAALEQWPANGIPPNPAGWLMTTARNRAIDTFRRQSVHRTAVATLAGERGATVDPSDTVVDALVDPVGDDLLGLLFIACHPALATDARVALTLRCVAGLRTDEIARAFLLTDAQAGQRISRAKKTLRDKGIRFGTPTVAEIHSRLGAVLEVIYLIFNEGYSATAGDDWMRPELTREATRLARLTAELLPGQPETHGLVALLELTTAREAARVAADGSPVLLPDQDRSQWDRLLIRRGLVALDLARATGKPVGPYTLQAAIAACHARALRAEDTDWAAIVEWYDLLSGVWNTPVVRLNRAVAIGEARGAAAGLAELDELAPDGLLAGYPYLPAARAELLARLGRLTEAESEFGRAEQLSRNDAERVLFRRRIDHLRHDR